LKHFYYIHIAEIPFQKGENSCDWTELSLKRKEGINLPSTRSQLHLASLGI